MCCGAIYQFEGEIIKTYFPNPKAKLPVRTKGGEIELIDWGRREAQDGQLPLGGWARLESIRDGVWDKYFFHHVKVMIDQFMEKDRATGASEWFGVNKGQYVHGIVANDAETTRLYVVTIEPDFEGAIHDRWPRVLTLS